MRYVVSIIGLVLSALSLWYMTHFIQNTVITDILLHWKIVLEGSVVLLVAYIIRAYKTWLLLNVSSKRIVDVAASLYVSIALNNVLPFRLGDVLRLFYLRTVLKMEVLHAVAALVVERLFDLLIIIGFFLTTIYFMAALPAHDLLLDLYQVLLPKKVSIVFFMPVMLFFLMLFLARRVVLRAIIPAWKKIRLSRARLLSLLFATSLQWLIEIPLLGFIVSRWIEDVPFLSAILSAFMGNLATLIPSAPGFVGTFEVAGLLPFQWLGAPALSKAAFFVLMYHLTIWFFSTVFGLFFSPFILFRMSWKTQERMAVFPLTQP